MTHHNRYFYGWQANAIFWLVLFTQPRTVSAQVKDTLFAVTQTAKEEPRLSFQLSSGLGYTPLSGGDVLWDVKLMLGTPVFSNGDMVWAGIVPTMVPASVGDEDAVDGFVPFVIEYEHNFHLSTTTPFLYANAGAGPQFGDRSNSHIFQAMMYSARRGNSWRRTIGVFRSGGRDVQQCSLNKRARIPRSERGDFLLKMRVLCLDFSGV